MVTKEYSPQHERCINWCNQEIGVNWPIKEIIIVSEKDETAIVEKR
jgi:dTDP-4-dehydrorhamnose 3,5-epimerase